MNEFYSLLYTTLLSNCPVDTRNMVTNIILEDYGTYVNIVINVDYAKYVNYNKQRTAKEAHNWHWVERAVRQVSEIFGGNVEYELS